MAKRQYNEPITFFGIMLNNFFTTGDKGQHGERIAVDYMLSQGMSLVTKNYHCYYGEIDLILLHQDTLIFVEVRYRHHDEMVSAIESIHSHKCKKIILSSKMFLQNHKKYQKHSCRYDVIGIVGDFDSPHIEWIKDAFQDYDFKV